VISSIFFVEPGSQQVANCSGKEIRAAPERVASSKISSALSSVFPGDSQTPFI
jgi:hypothetical protein